MPRRLLPIAACALALAALAPASAAAADIRIGIGDQSSRTFDHPEFQRLDLRQVRYFVRWNTIHHRSERHLMRAWVKAARAKGLRPLLHISTTTFEPKQAPRPSVRTYRRDVGRLVRYLRALGVKDFGTWNEANHKTQPTWDSPNHAALYFKEMYRAVHRGCSPRTCRVVALDVLDQRGAERYVERFYERLRTPTWTRRAKIVGIHNYADANRGGRLRTRGIIRAVRRHNRGARFWFTETGGLVGFGKNFPCDPSSPSSVARAERRAAKAVRHVFRLARMYRGAGVRRVYLYNWFGNDCVPNDRTQSGDRAADEQAGFDAGLVRADGSARAGLEQVRDALKGARRGLL